MKLFKILDLILAIPLIFLVAILYFLNRNSDLYSYAIIAFLIWSFISIVIHMGHFRENWVLPKRNFLYLGFLPIIGLVIYGNLKPLANSYDDSMLHFIGYSLGIFGLMALIHHSISAIELWRMLKPKPNKKL
jgi:hypothetical protein